MKHFLLFTLSLLFFLQTDFAQAQNTFYVSGEDGNDTNPGTENLPLATIQAAVDKANAGDSIKVNPGGYSDAFSVSKSVIIQGIGEGTEQTPLAVTISNAFDINASDVVLQNLLLNNDVTIASGGDNVSILNSTIFTSGTITVSSGVSGFTLNESDLSGASALAIINDSGNTVDASYNWWGSAEKADFIGKIDPATVAYSPWLNNGDDTSLLVGFQPDLSSVSVDGSGDGDLQSAANNLAPGSAITLLFNSTAYSSLEATQLLTIVTTAGSEPQIENISTTGATSNDTILVIDGDIIVENSINLNGGSLFTTESSQITLNPGASLLEQEGFLIGDIIQNTIDNGVSSINSLGARISAGTGTSSLGAVSINRITGDQGIVQANDTTSVATKWIISAQNDPLPEGEGRIVTLFWFSNFNNGQNISTAVMWRQLDDSDTWEPVGSEPNPSSGTSNVFSISTSEPITQFSTWTISSDAAPLPVTLVDFAARLDETSVRLDWATATETNAHFFGIERSTDGIFFDEIARNQAVGESTDLHSYLYIDEGIANRLTGTLYYRLRMVDFDETFEYSNIVAVSLSGDNDLRVYADASAGTLQLFTQQLPAGNYLVQVSDMLGNILIESNLTTSEENPVYAFPLNSPARSVYVVRCFGAQALYTQKFRLE